MKIGLRAGHSDNCTGSIGIVNEHEQMKLYYAAVKTVFEKYGHTVIDCNSNASTQGGELSEGANKANKAGVDLFISLHMNAFDGTAHGTEVLISSTSSASYPYAKRLVDNFASLGFKNRGVKCERLYEMNHVAAPNIISEICFCDNQKDINIYNQYSWEELAHTLCNAIDPNIPKKVSTTKYKVGWNKDNTGWFYSTDGNDYYKCGWKLIDSEWYYFNHKGYILIGWQNIENEWYYFKENEKDAGKLYGGWLTQDSKTYYLEEKHNGKFGVMYRNGKFKIDNKEYAFDENGVLLK